VDVVFQTVVFVLVVVGQSLACKPWKGSSVQNKPACNAGNQTRAADMAHGVLKVVVLHCVCGAVLSCANLGTYLGHVTEEEDTAADLAVFLLHLNAALNPCVYVVNHAMASRRRAAHGKLPQLLKLREAQRARGHTHGSADTGRNNRQPGMQVL
jgi:hypothetical protein